jgi:hypothetical protein
MTLALQTEGLLSRFGNLFLRTIESGSLTRVLMFNASP